MADHVLIVGGGIGRLGCALALIRRRIDVEVCEQAAERREVGAGVQLGANGTRVLHALGLKGAFAATRFFASGRQARLWSAGRTEDRWRRASVNLIRRFRAFCAYRW